MSQLVSTTVPWFFERLQQYGSRVAIVWHGRSLTYSHLIEQIDVWRLRFRSESQAPGSVCGVLGDHTVDAFVAMLAAWQEGLVVTPICSLPDDRYEAYLASAFAELVVSFTPSGDAQIERRAISGQNTLLSHFRQQSVPGLVLFSSGSTGESKAILWNAERLIERHRAVTQAPRTLMMLRLDHIGGLNTLLYSLSGGGTIVVIAERDPVHICSIIEKERVELLPCSPTFLNMLLLSGAWRNFDLSSLRRITYGTEPMSTGILKALDDALPNVDLKQTYGLSELGILPTKSRGRDSLWLRVGGAGFETRIHNGQLHIRTPAAMVGYLNQDNPFDAQGWFNTQDEVEVDGDYVRILGRTSDIINVGGEKVYPAEVENVLLEAENVLEATVCAQHSPVTGQIVTASVSLKHAEDLRDAERRLIAFCRNRLALYQVPMLINITTEPLHNARGKSIRRPMEHLS